MQKVLRVAERVSRVHKRLPSRVPERRRGQRRHFTDEPHRGLAPHGRVGQILAGRGVERRQRGDDRAEHRHRVRVRVEALEELEHALADHRVARDLGVERGLLRRRRQVAVEEHVGCVVKVAEVGEVGDVVAAVAEDAPGAVDPGDLGDARGCFFVVCVLMEVGKKEKRKR